MTLSADLSGKVAIVTGASSGLGKRFCTVLAENGATVVAAARRLDRLQELAATDPRIVPVRCDVGVDEDCVQLVKEAHVLGGPHILVNAAGFGESLPALETPMADFRRTIEIDLTATFQLAVEARRVMEPGGSIINIAPILGLVGSSPLPQSAYAAAKGGVINLTRSLGTEWARDGIRVNAIAPGWFPSELTQDMFAEERTMSWLRRNLPIGRVGEPHELDGVLLLLASSASTYITGQTLVVDGGWTAR